MRRYFKIILPILISLSICLITSPTYANYQSNNGAKAVVGPGTWAIGIRNMEATNNVMGLTETINGDGTYSGASNNIDVHMQKNTEYGTMAILSASKEYGKTGSERNVLKETKTTTGNASGVSFDDYSNEWVAGGNRNFLGSMASRYRNNYNGGSTPIAGDAMNIGNWHKNGGNGNRWTSGIDNGYVRPYSGSNASNYPIFTFDYSYSNSYRSRACIVNGIGF